MSDAVIDLSARPLVKGLIEQGALAVIYGPSGSGKSFFTADIGQHIAQGAAWRGRRCTQSLVLYVASEAGGSIVKRFVAWRDNRLGDASGPLPLAILTRGPNLLQLTDHEKLVEQIDALQKQSGMPLGLVVFDTLSRSIPGGDENSTEDITQAIYAADYIRDRFKAATIFVHHSGKDPDKGMRGHSSLKAAADLVLFVDENVASVEKVRDGVAGERFAFVLEPVEIGTDADGDPVMTCLLNATDSTVKPDSKMPSGRNQKIVLPVLREMALERAERSPGTSAIPKGVLVVSMTQAIERVVSKFGPDDPAYRVREKVREAMLGLQAGKFIGIHGDIIWLA